MNSEAPVRHVTMDDHDKINGLRFSMERIDMKQTLNSVEYWDVTNTNNSASGMLHPFHIHGAHFLVVSRNGKSLTRTKSMSTRTLLKSAQAKLSA